MAPLSHKKDRGVSKSGFVLKDQSVTLKGMVPNRLRVHCPHTIIESYSPYESRVYKCVLVGYMLGWFRGCCTLN